MERASRAASEFRRKARLKSNSELETYLSISRLIKFQTSSGSRRLSPMLGLAFAALSWLVPAHLANAEESFRCASENQFCSLPATYDHFSTSFGSPNRSIIVETENLRVLPCSNDLGDPHGNVAKSCNAVEVHNEPAGSELSFKRCAGENQNCAVPHVSNEYYVVRYGANGKWLYNNVASDVWCANGGFGFGVDPVPNVVKSCEVSTTPLKGISSGNRSQWQTCANEGGDCVPRSGFGSYLIRYGADTRWLYRTVIGKGLACGAGPFGSDPAYGTYKSCQYIGIPTVREVQGEWKQVVACGGCEPHTFRSTWGVEKGKERSSTSHWTQEVKVSVESGFKVKGVGGTANVESTTSFGESETVASSFTQIAGTEIEIPCAKGALWQLNTKVDEFCRPNSPSCSTTSKTQVFQCAALGELPKANWPTSN